MRDVRIFKPARLGPVERAPTREATDSDHLSRSRCCGSGIAMPLEVADTQRIIRVASIASLPLCWPFFDGTVTSGNKSTRFHDSENALAGTAGGRMDSEPVSRARRKHANGWMTVLALGLLGAGFLACLYVLIGVPAAGPGRLAVPPPSPPLPRLPQPPRCTGASSRRSPWLLRPVPRRRRRPPSLLRTPISLSMSSRPS